MIGFWIGAAVLTAIVLLLLLRPLLRPPVDQTGPADYARKVYKDQVEEIERDLRRGVLTPEQAKAARAEVGRRLLATTDKAGRDGAAPATGPSHKLAVGMVVLLPLAALLIYIQIGRPELPSVPFAQQQAQRPPVPPQVLDALAKLEQKLQEDPNDLQGWTLAAQTYAAMGRHEEAAEAYRKAAGLSQGDPELVSSFAEAMVMANDGIVGEEALRAFEAVQEQDAGNPRAAFYLGLARQQAGDPQGAIGRWAELMRRSPADAPWVPLLRQRIHDVATQVGIDPVEATPDPLPPVGAGQPQAGTPTDNGGNAAPLLTPEQMQEMANLPPEEQQAVIRSMVEGLQARLEENPGDAEGWRRLARARGVLGEPAAAAEALRRATEAAPDRTDIWLDYARALAEADAADGAEVPAQGFIDALAKVLELDPANPQALYYLGADAARRGESGRARELWTKLLGIIPEASPDHAELKRQLDALPQG